MKKMTFFFACFSCFYSILLSETAFSQDMGDNDEPGLHKIRAAFKYSIETPKTYDGLLSVPLYQNEMFSTSVFTKMQELHFPNLPANSITNSTDFYDQQYGLKMSYLQDQDNSWHLNTAYGSASDQTFESGDVSNFSVTLIRKRAITPNSSLSLFLNYATNRSVLKNAPLPGFAYAFSADDRSYGYVLGLPFAVYWARPTEKISTSAFVLLPSTLRTSIGYMIRPPFQANLKFQWAQDMFNLADRREDDIRFYYETKKIATSLKTFLGPQNFFEIEAAKLFDRAIYDGKSPVNLTSDRINLTDEWQLTASAQAAF